MTADKNAHYEPRSRHDSVFSARALFIEEACLEHVDGNTRDSLEGLGRTFRLVAVRNDGVRASRAGRALPSITAAGIVGFSRSNGVELYASWYIGNAPDLGFRGVLEGGTGREFVRALRAIEKNEAKSRIIVDPDRLGGIVESLRRRGARIVFTNGIFDLVHVGHLRLLEKARRLGDVLIVGMNSDDSTRKLKGSSRPVVPQFARAETLISLRAVDYCFIFVENDPKRVLAIVRPEVLAKGSDYPLRRVVGARFVAGYGGSVVRLPLVEGFSTTSTIRRIGDGRPAGLGRIDSPP